MLNNNKSTSQIRHGMLAQNQKVTETSEISDEDLIGVMRVLEGQAQQYKKAGLTQVSNWL